MNRTKPNKHGYKGIYWNDKMGAYVARITSQGKRQLLGYFGKAIDAARAYDKAAMVLFGEFARLNF